MQLSSFLYLDNNLIFFHKCAAAGVPGVLFLSIRAKKSHSCNHLKTKPFLLKLNIYIYFSANVDMCYFIDEYISQMMLYEDTKHNCRVIAGFLATEWLSLIWIQLVWIWTLLLFDLRKWWLYSATWLSSTTVLHSCEMQLFDKLSTAPACDGGQLFVGFERRVLVLLCDLTRLKISKLSHIKLRSLNASVLSWPEFLLFLSDHKDWRAKFCWSSVTLSQFLGSRRGRKKRQHMTQF